MKLNRREFIQRGLALAAMMSVSIKLPGSDEEQVIEIVDFQIDDSMIRHCFQWGKTIVDGTVAGIKATLDVKCALKAAYFIDANGNRYPYRIIERMMEMQEARQPMAWQWGMHEYA